jgi:hypothetical protein
MMLESRMNRARCPYSASIMSLLTGKNNRFAPLGDLIHPAHGRPITANHRDFDRAFLHGMQSTPSLENAG